MKTILTILLMLMVCSVVMAEESKEDLLAMAGQGVLSYYTEQLKKADDEIFIYMQEEIASDRVVDGKEMKGLQKRVKALSNLKKEAVEQLEVYGITLGFDLFAKIEIKEKIIFEYFNHVIRNRDQGNHVRRLFAQVTEQNFKNLEVKTNFDWLPFAILAGATVLGVIIILILILSKKTNGWVADAAIVVAVISFIALIIGLVS